MQNWYIRNRIIIRWRYALIKKEESRRAFATLRDSSSVRDEIRTHTAFRPLPPQSSVSTNSTTRTWVCILWDTRVKWERKTGLEPATPTLARLCSTNWAIFAYVMQRACSRGGSPPFLLCKGREFFYSEQIFEELFSIKFQKIHHLQHNILLFNHSRSILFRLGKIGRCGPHL